MKRYDIIWAKSAESDMENIIEYLKLDSQDVAKKIFYEIKNECQKLQNLPQRKRVVPELQQIGISKYREIMHKRWRIIYSIEDKKVFVLLVVDSSRDLEDILFQRLVKA